jgi:TatD DNase family protein
MILIDTHAHIYAPEFAEDRADMLKRAFEQGVQQIYMPNIDRTSIEAMLRLEEEHRGNCFAMMGLHPCYVNAGFEQELRLVEEWLGRKSFIALGEIGLDYYWSTEFKAQQEEAFAVQVNLAKKYQLPVVIHCRNSFGETVALLQKIGTDGITGIFHCFTGTLADARQVIDMGFMLGIGGVSTFKNGGLDKVLPSVDLRHIVLETDSPYLAPVPYRGKRNEVSYTALVARRVADIMQVRVEDVAATTTENALRLMKVSLDS